MNQLQPEAIKTFQKENLSVLVDEYIKNKILKGKYKEGDRILEADIASELGISRGPVREGIKIAEQEGVITVEPRKGAYVTRFDKQDIQEVFEIRMLLEKSILEDLIVNKKLNEKDFDALNKIIDNMVKTVNSSKDQEEKTLELNKKDIYFHQFIWKKSGSKRKEKVLNQFFFQLRQAMLYDTRFTEDLTKTAVDHYRIVRYLREEDLENCQQALVDHILTY